MKKHSIYNVLQVLKNDDYTNEDVLLLLNELQRRGYIISYIINDGGVSNYSAVEWLMDFWTPQKSAYLSEKERKGQPIHNTHTDNSRGFIKNHWLEILKDKKLGELGRQDIQNQFNRLDELKLNGNTKNHILQSVLTPLKWAYNNELLSKDLSKGWIMYKVEYKKRTILSMEIARQIFSAKWDNDLACLASMLAMCTGMRCGEILALTYEDLGNDCIYVRHSYNLKDGLKCTKNREARTVYVPFSFIMQRLRYYADLSKKKILENTISEKSIGFIFCGTSPQRPMDRRVCLNHLRVVLIKTGMTEAEAQQITFHAWRHFYTTYMAEKVNQKALQGQTGHKTAIMLEHYANHQTLEEAKQIKDAQTQLFGQILSE